MNTNNLDTQTPDTTITHEINSSVASSEYETQTPKITHVPVVINGLTRGHHKLYFPYGSTNNISNDLDGD